MLALMPHDDEAVRLQCSIRHATRRRLKAAAVEHDVEMGDVADAILAHVLPLLAAGKAPAPITTAIEKARKLRQDQSGE